MNIRKRKLIVLAGMVVFGVSCAWFLMEKKPIAISPILIMVTVWIVYDIWLSIKNGEINSSGITVRYKENSILFIFFTLAEAIALLFLIWMYIENLRTGQPEN